MSGQAALLRAVHAQPGITRVSAAHELEMPSGFAAETIARLAALELLIEHPAPPTGRRGRPTTSLHPHPRGPLVAVADIAHETWRVAAVQLGGSTVESVQRPHQRDRAEVLAAVAGELDSLGRRYGGRIRAVAVAVPGTVVGSRLVQAPNLGWHDVDLSILWPRYDPGCRFLTGNDATFAAIAEARRGAATGAGTIVHLYMDAGVGGAVIEGGRVLLGATGMAGEFGHMPFGDPALRCRCGATGCWNTSLDGHAVARALGQPVPADDVTYTRRVIAAAKANQTEELSAIQAVARSLGRGAAGLANAFDPHLLTVGGLGRDLLAVAGEQAGSAYLDGLMRFRTSPPPPLVPAHFTDNAPLVGAAEDALAAVLTDEGLRAWSARTPSVSLGTSDIAVTS
jgi:predicted NBD/HSP70 family sugar kinase